MAAHPRQVGSVKIVEALLRRGTGRCKVSVFWAPWTFPGNSHLVAREYFGEFPQLYRTAWNCAEADLFGHVHLDVAKSIVRTDDADYVFRISIFYSLLSRACVCHFYK